MSSCSNFKALPVCSKVLFSHIAETGKSLVRDSFLPLMHSCSLVSRPPPRFYLAAVEKNRGGGGGGGFFSTAAI